MTDPNYYQHLDEMYDSAGTPAVHLIVHGPSASHADAPRRQMYSSTLTIWMPADEADDEDELEDGGDDDSEL